MKILVYCLGFLLWLPSLGMAQSDINSDLCFLSISSASGQNSVCNAVHIGNGRLLTAAHCFPAHESIVKNGLIIARCGNDEFMDFIKINQVSTTKLTTNGEDISVAHFKPALSRRGLRPTTNPSMYFDNSQVKPGAECEIHTIRNDQHKIIKIDSSTHLTKLSDTQGSAVKIIHKKKRGESLGTSFAVKYGDSGSALLCRYAKNKPLELVGITVDVRTLKSTNQPVQNTFSPVFGPEAKRLLSK